MSTVSVPSEGCEGLVCSVCFSFWWFPGNLWCPLACRYVTPISSFMCAWISPLSACLSLCTIFLLLVAQSLKRLPAIRETRVWSLGWEDPLEKEMATRSSNLASKISWMKEPGRLQSTGSQRVGCTWVTNTSTSRNYLMLIFSNLWTACHQLCCKPLKNGDSRTEWWKNKRLERLATWPQPF